MSSPLNLVSFLVVLVFGIISCAGLSLAVMADEALIGADDIISRANPADLRELRELGKRIYRHGVLPNGKLLEAKLQLDVPLEGQAVACANCHKRSGLGSGEGDVFAPPVIGSILYSDGEVIDGALRQRRIPYTDASLRRVIHDGISPDGRTLNYFMPRYQLTDEEANALITYLKTLSRHPSPGVGKQDLHLATVIAGDVAEGDRQALLGVLRTFIGQHNRRTRNETGRARRGPWYKDWQYRSYRNWVLHEWRITGPVGTWPAQLEKYYREQPVFVLVSGLASGPWQPIHRFCEHKAVPCIFPTTELPYIDSDAYYPVYFSRGIDLQAEVLGRYLNENRATGGQKIVQIYRGEAISRRSAEAFSRMFDVQGDGALKTVRVGDGCLAVHEIRRLFQQENPHAIVLWLRDCDIAALASLGPGRGIEHIYLSASLVESLPESLPSWLMEKIVLLYPYALPQKRDRQLGMLRQWASLNQLPFTNEKLQADAFFAMRLTGRVIKHLNNHYSRDYFIEILEHVVDNAVTSSVYPHVSLGPGQRFAVRGSYLVRIDPKQRSNYLPVSEWLIP